MGIFDQEFDQEQEQNTTEFSSRNERSMLTPTPEQLDAMGLADFERDEFIQLWETIFPVYMATIEGDPSAFEDLEAMEPGIAEMFAQSMDQFMEQTPEQEFVLPDNVRTRIDDMRQRSLDQFRTEMDRQAGIFDEGNREAYSRALGPGYETSTPYAQSQALFNREFQPAVGRGVTDILNQSDTNALQNLQYFSGLDSQNRAQEFNERLSRVGTMSDIFNNTLGQQNQQRQINTGNLQNALNLGQAPYQAALQGTQVWGPYGIQQVGTAGSGQTNQEVSGGSFLNDLFRGAIGGGLSALGGKIGSFIPGGKFN